MNPALAEEHALPPFDLAAYDYELPPERIAQEPLAERDAARLLLLDRNRGGRAHRRVRDLPGLLRRGDLLVVNDTRVRPARLRGVTETGAAAELLLLRQCEPGLWECMARPVKRLRPGRNLRLAGGAAARVESAGNARVVVRFDSRVSVEDLLREHGEVPLPPYIRRPEGCLPADRERYQTVYARVPGAVAAPTAGLHLTADLLAALRFAGVQVVSLTLHVGPGTFLPVREGDVRGHRMEAEWVEIPEETAQALAEAKMQGRRVVAVGTTTTRALESRARRAGTVMAGAGWADLFILPGHHFRVVDALLTNFHLPRSTLLLLVAAFAGREAVLAAYREAVECGYRFYSYGDAMLISSGGQGDVG